MDTKYASWMCCLIFSAMFASKSDRVEAVRPKIVTHLDDSTDVILRAGDNFNMTCQGSKPLKWVTPEVQEPKNTWTTFSVKDFESTHNSDYHYGAVLYITNMSYPFVGFYVCAHQNDSENYLSESKSDENDSIYLYVNDTEHLSVLDEYPIQPATQYQETTIPCRPTAPDVKVELMSFDEELTNVVETEKLIMDECEDMEECHFMTFYRFDPRYGFITNDTKVLSDSKRYDCKFSKARFVESYTTFLSIEAGRTHLATPFVKDLSDGHTDVGQTLELQCVLRETSPFIDFKWKTPRGESKANNILTSEDQTSLIATYTKYNVTIQDKGVYTCIVSDTQKHTSSGEAEVSVYGIDQCFITMAEENYLYKIEVERPSEPVQWIIKVKSHPKPQLKWLDPMGRKIESSFKYATNITSNMALLLIRNVSVMDSGIYVLHGKSARRDKTTGLETCLAEKELKLELEVKDAPIVDIIHTQEYYLINRTAKIKCVAIGNPVPSIVWQHKKCLDTNCQVEKVQRPTHNMKYQSISYLEVDTANEGEVTCSASNPLGKGYRSSRYHISDVKGGFDVYDFGENAVVEKDGSVVKTASGDELAFSCGVARGKSDEIKLFYNDVEITGNSDRHSLERSFNILSNKARLSIQKGNISDSGIYSCRIRDNKSGKYQYKNVTFVVSDPQKPEIVITNLDKPVDMEYPNAPLKLFCKYRGIPKPLVEWFKDGVILKTSEHVFLEENNQVLIFNKTRIEDEGSYKCEVSNNMGVTFKETQLKFKYKHQNIIVYYYMIGAIGVLLLIATIYIVIKVRKERKLKMELKLLGLENFHKGNPENLNPELGIDDQAELLPYKKEWEFPVEQLKLGKQLGSGAFGVVMKAEARRIIDGEEKTTVAVKMVKKNADQSYIRALASELKIMVHLGKHVNVVNLLGACTKNVAKRELYVIVEYCRYGNLQNYLLRHRDSFVNQIQPRTGKLDFSIGSEFLDRSYSVTSDNGIGPPTPHASMQDYRGKCDSITGSSNATQMTTLPDEMIMTSNGSMQPEWRSNYRGDYRGCVKPVTTRDLIAWSFQVARGMEYLASRRVLHGDLAARNILLTDDNVVKICDFGLAKTMYNDNNYKKKGNGPVPVKWMAVESITDRVFSTQSDIWSFGIVLWELFSLGKTPYPGMEANERLYNRLVEGYRMESPEYAPKEVYEMMLDCWQSKPLARPSFTKLVEKIGCLLEDSVRKHYVDLNDPYLAINTQKFEENDYLAMLSPPSFDVLSTPPPHYANESVVGVAKTANRSQTDSVADGYLFMGGNTIFSPRVNDDSVFDFNLSRRKNTNELERVNGAESRPMLHSQNESDTEQGYLIPDVPANSVSNPSYHMLPVKSSSPSPRQRDLIGAPDNYVNMPQCKSLADYKDKNKESVRVDIRDNGGNVHYVNVRGGVGND
ncbi:vascular endothelial growth factor receptor 1 isoform X2 [Cylas formicarius]|uniref:vascular endothelial growth factor receptor 1 isoform X2 n=1 Tax=Cylas formicarius TaxID=197179 RepID=UPI0029589B8A|nr:vascular endothelial growth factor receptor 1 isoform X2 [Cylas formicarius]